MPLNRLVSSAITNAPKEKDGSISRKNAIKLLQNIFKNEDGCYRLKSKQIETFDGGLYRATSYGYGFGGFLSQTKDLFELYMDRDSEGGEAITQNEQKEIISTINGWMKSFGIK